MIFIGFKWTLSLLPDSTINNLAISIIQDVPFFTLVTSDILGQEPIHRLTYCPYFVSVFFFFRRRFTHIHLCGNCHDLVPG